MKRTYGLTFVAEFAIIATSLLVFSIAANYWTPARFGEYVLGRRVLSLLYSTGFLALAISLPRFVALASATGDDRSALGGYLVAATGLATGALAIIGLAFVVAPRPIAGLLFGGVQFRPLLPALYLCVVGAFMHSLAYGYFRGQLLMVHANVLQVANQGIAHLMVFAWPRRTPTEIFWAVGALWVATAGSTLVLVTLRTLQVRLPTMREVAAKARTLLRYGLPRMPGDVALVVLLTAPATLAAHIAGIEQAGYVAFSISVLGMAGSAFGPIGLVLLPDATGMAARGETQRLRRLLAWLVTIAVSLTAVGVLVGEVATTPLLRWYLGEAYVRGAGVLRIVLIGAVPYVAYVVLRSALDALTVSALNARNLSIGVVVFGVVVALHSTLTGIALGLAGALLITGLLTMRDAWRLTTAVDKRGLS